MGAEGSQEVARVEHAEADATPVIRTWPAGIRSNASTTKGGHRTDVLASSRGPALKTARADDGIDDERLGPNGP